VKRWRKPVSYGIPCIIEHEVGLLQVIISNESQFDAAILDEEFAFIPEWI